MLWLLALVPGLGAGLPYLFGRGPARLALAAVSAGTMVVTLVLATVAVAGRWSADWIWSGRLLLTARLDPVSAAMVVLVPLIALPVVLYAATHEPRQGLARLVAMLMLFVGAMELLLVADDLLTLLIGWELVGACSWVLIAHDWQEAGPPRDAGTAFLVTRAGDLGLFLAAMVTYASTGSFSYAALGSMDGALLELAAAGVIVAAAAKSAQLPFSFWLFNAMSGPSPVSALLHAATMVAAGAYLLARLNPILQQVAWFTPAVTTVGLATALAGGVVALIQPDVKKVLAASTSAHYGMMFIAAGTGHPAVAVPYLIVHAGYKSLLFLGAGAATSAKHRHTLAGMRDGPRMPVAAALVLIGSAALAGVPPLGGAWTRERVEAAAGTTSTGLALGVLLAGALSAAYALRWQWLALGPGEYRRDRPSRRPSRLVLGSLAIPAALSVAFSLAWLPPVHEAIGQWFGTSLPNPKPWERIAGLLLVLGGLGLGVSIARRWPSLGERGAAASAADWLGLPAAVRTVVARPAVALAAAMARFDNRVLDAGVFRVAAFGRRLAALTAAFDDRTVDGGVAAVARTGGEVAGLGNRVLETLTDRAVEGTAAALSAGGAYARQLETGLAHHYLVWVAVGAGLLAAFMLIAG